MSLRERTEQSAELSAGHIWQTRSHIYGEGKCQAEVRSDVVIPNELGNDEICQGLRHWRLLPNLKNNFSKPVRNDMNNNNSRSVLPSRQLNKLDCFAFARNDQRRHTEGDSPKYLLTSQVYIDSSLTLRMTVHFGLPRYARDDIY